MNLSRLGDLEPNQVLIPSLALPERDFPWWRGVNLGRIALNYALSSGKSFSPPIAGSVHLSSFEFIARQQASAEAGAMQDTYQVNQEVKELLKSFGYVGDGRFPGLVVGVIPSTVPNLSKNIYKIQDPTEITVASIAIDDIDKASQELLNKLFQD